MQSFHCPHGLYQDLISSTQNWLVNEGFEHQKLTTEEKGILLRVEKHGKWKKMIGMSTALDIVFHQIDNTVNVQIGAGRWADKAVVGAVSMVVLWPLAVTSGLGAWEQAKMPERIYEHIAMFLSQHDST
jgi:hypothetical protein